MLFAARPHKEEVPLQVECDQYIAGERGTPIHFRTTQAANYKLLICRAQAMGQYKGTAVSLHCVHHVHCTLVHTQAILGTETA